MSLKKVALAAALGLRITEPVVATPERAVA